MPGERSRASLRRLQRGPRGGGSPCQWGVKGSVDRRGWLAALRQLLGSTSHPSMLTREAKRQASGLLSKHHPSQCRGTPSQLHRSLKQSLFTRGVGWEAGTHGGSDPLFGCSASNATILPQERKRGQRCWSRHHPVTDGVCALVSDEGSAEVEGWSESREISGQDGKHGRDTPFMSASAVLSQGRLAEFKSDSCLMTSQ